MSKLHNLTNPITLKDGRTIATVSQAREIMLSIPLADRQLPVWRLAAQRLKGAATDHLLLDESEQLLKRALKIEGLL